MRTIRTVFVSVAVLAVAVAIVVVAMRSSRPAVTTESVRTVIIETLLSDTQEHFLVTGTLTFATEVRQQSEKTLLPGILSLDLGTTTAVVRAAGRAAYGFDITRLDVDRIRVAGDTVFVVLPPLEVFAVEPDLESLEQQVDVGWARLYRSSGQQQILLALRRLQPAMRERAQEFLVREAFPGERTAVAIERMLTPALSAVGLTEPIFVFLPGPGPDRATDGPERLPGS